MWKASQLGCYLHYSQEPVIKPLHELDTSALQEILPEIPLWIKSPDYDRVSSLGFLS